MPLDLSLYLANPIRTKGLDSSIFKNYTSYVYLVLEQPLVPPTYIPNFVGNQFLIIVQPMINEDRQLA